LLKWPKLFETFFYWNRPLHWLDILFHELKHFFLVGLRGFCRKKKKIREKKKRKYSHRLLVCSSVRSFVSLFVCSFFVCSSVRLFVRSFVRRSFVCLFVRSSVRLFDCSIVRLFVCLFVCLFVRLFVCLFVRRSSE
jgi:hypothetical protein